MGEGKKIKLTFFKNDTDMIKAALSCLLVFLSAPALAQDAAIPQSQTQITLSFSPVVKKVAPSVVNIFTKRTVTQAVNPFANDPFFSQFFGGQRGLGMTRQRLENSLGSGVIVAADGLVVTNAHVVRNAEEIKVNLSDAREFDAKIVLVDDASDLALLRIDTKEEKLPFATLQPSETLEVGDLILAIGNPFGVGQTVTSGIVSALARSSLSISDLNFFIQTDAAINPGNSGGPLVSMSGGVVGINSAIYSRDGGSLGIGFAIPSEMVATVIAAEKSGQVNRRGGISRPWVGIAVQDVTSDIAASLGLSHPVGALVSGLHEASPARDAGLEQGDVVTAVNGKPVRDAAELRFRLSVVPLNDVAHLDYLRKGDKKTAEMKTILPPDKPARDTTVLKGNHPFSGVTVLNLNPAAALDLGIHDDKGVAISVMPPTNDLSRVLKAGDIIDELNGQKILTVSDLSRTLAKRARSWQLVVTQDGQKRQINIR